VHRKQTEWIEIFLSMKLSGDYGMTVKSYILTVKEWIRWMFNTWSFNNLHPLMLIELVFY